MKAHYPYGDGPANRWRTQAEEGVQTGVYPDVPVRTKVPNMAWSRTM